MVPRYFIVCNESDIEKLVVRTTDPHVAAHWAGIKVYDREESTHQSMWWWWLKKMNKWA